MSDARFGPFYSNTFIVEMQWLTLRSCYFCTIFQFPFFFRYFDLIPKLKIYLFDVWGGRFVQMGIDLELINFPNIVRSIN